MSSTEIVWIGFLATARMFHLMAIHCTDYDEERSIMRARVLPGRAS